MSGLLKATDASTRVGLMKSLERATARGYTSVAETLLGAITDRYPRGSTDAAIRALNCAVHCRQWATASYLASFLADTARPRVTEGGGAPISGEHIDQEVLRCLADHRAAEPNKLFLLTDAIEDQCLERGVAFARLVATADRSYQGAAPGDHITFEHVDPNLPPDAYGGTNNPCTHFSLAEPDRSAATLRGRSDQVVSPGVLKVQVSFPSEIAGVYEVETSGTRESLARAIAVKYGELLSSKSNATYDLSDLDLKSVAPGGDGNPFAVTVVA